MNGDDFYEEFKNSLDFLDVRWGDKAVVDVSVKGDSIILSYGNKSARIVIGSKENQNDQAETLFRRSGR